MREVGDLRDAKPYATVDLSRQSVSFHKVMEDEEEAAEDISEPPSHDQRKENVLEDLLQALDLMEFFPKKLSKTDAIKIQKIDLCSTASEPRSKAWVFLKRILSQTSSEFTSDDSISEDIEEDWNGSEEFPGKSNNSYLSFLLAVFLCCNDFLRRHLADKLVLAQKAIPFLVPVTNEILIWPLRIIKGWSENNVVNDRCLATTPMPLISAIQVGTGSTNGASKLLNLAFSGDQVSYKGYCEDRDELCNGYAEIGCFFPSGKYRTDAWPVAMAGISLHGTAEECPQQVQFLREISTFLCVYIESLDNDISNILPFLKIGGKSNVILFKCENDNAKSVFKKWLEKHELENCTVILFRDYEVAARGLKLKIKKILPGVKPQSVEFLCHQSEQSHFSVDEKGDLCVKGRNLAESLMESLEHRQWGSLRKECLPLQEAWKVWATVDKEQYRLKNLSSTVTSEKYISNLELKKMKIIEEMHKLPKSPEFLKFLGCLEENAPETSYFLEWLHMKLNCLSSNVMSSLQEKYLELSIKDPKSENLKMLDGELHESSFGLEHFFREMATMWAMCCSREDSQHLVQWFPNTVANLVLQGWPLEIMDADAAHVPVKWIKAVLDTINEGTDRSAVFVTSILGVQSSGKSTFLNTMFGVNFAVSSGRCTKGAFLQLVPVAEDVRDDLGCDFFAIVDTEGLKSEEHAGFNNEHDNELSTLTIGISDLSLINIGTENYESMKDVLQIVCYAFLRMTAVCSKPQCMIIHQNISDPSAKKKNAQARMKFIASLDEMTQAAAEMEGASKRYKTFSDVIEYDPEHMSIYVPGLWHGTPPMAFVNAEYARIAEMVKQSILKHINIAESISLGQLARRIEDVSTAVLRENFIFSFQNTAATKAHQIMRDFYIHQKWEVRNDILEWLMNYHTSLKEIPEEQLLQQKEVIMNEGEKILEDATEQLKSEVQDYYNAHKGLSSVLEESRKMIELDIETNRNCLSGQIEVSVEKFLKQEITERKILAITKEKEDCINMKVLELQTKYSHNSPELSEEGKHALKQEFETVWTDMLSQVTYEQEAVDENIKLVMERCLREYIKAHEKHLGKQAERRITDASLDEDKLCCQVSENDVTFHKNNCQKLYEVPQKIADETLEMCKERISAITSTPAGFTEQYCFKILQYVDNKIKNAASSGVFSFSSYYRVQMLNLLCQFSIAKLQAMHDEHLKRGDPKHRLNGYKERYFNLLISGTEMENHIKLFCEELSHNIISCLKNDLPVYISSTIRRTCERLKSRKCIQLHILLQLESKDSFDEYMKYINYFKEYVLSWIRKVVIHFMNDRVENMTRLQYLLAQLSFRVIDQLKEVIHRSVESSDGVYHVFLQTLQQEISSAKVKASFDDQSIERMKMLKISDTEKFMESLSKNFGAKIQSYILENVDALSVEEVLNSMYPPIQDELYELLMCKDGAQCPFCGIPCDRSGPHQQHAADLHQPQGIKSFCYGKTRKLVHEICTTLVAGNGYFDSKDSRETRFKNKDYRKVYPDWDIKPSQNVQASKYWKRFLMRFNKQLSEYYGCEAADIPEIWKTYDWNAVKEQLEEIYEMEIDELEVETSTAEHSPRGDAEVEAVGASKESGDQKTSEGGSSTEKSSQSKESEAQRTSEGDRSTEKSSQSRESGAQRTYEGDKSTENSSQSRESEAQRTSDSAVGGSSTGKSHDSGSKECDALKSSDSEAGRGSSQKSRGTDS